MRKSAFTAVACILSTMLVGCAAIPDIRSEPQFHNPFPQLHRVAVLPFVNQSQEPTLDTDRVTIAYHNELQKLPGFEVKPLGVIRTQMQAMGIELSETTDFQALAQHLDVDVVILGAVTEYTPYYPPRLGMRVHWYSANPGFHPIPPGYGLPWGTAEEEYIPDRLVHEAEFALAREQLKTQTPDYLKTPLPQPTIRPQAESQELPQDAPMLPKTPPQDDSEEEIPSPNLSQPPDMDGGPRNARRVSYHHHPQHAEVDGSQPPYPNNRQSLPSAASHAPQVGAQHSVHHGPSAHGQIHHGHSAHGHPAHGQLAHGHLVHGHGQIRHGHGIPPHPAHGMSPDQMPGPPPQQLPPDWPDPVGFLPEGPRPSRPPLVPQSEPIISHTRLYDGNDEHFTQQVSEYFYFRDDARFGGWQAYLQRSEDFIRVCCYLHVTETLAARGGAGKSRVVWRWPIGRYER